MKQTEARKRLDEMNLMDDFLFTQMISSPEYGERFSRLLIQTLFQRKIGKLTIRHQHYLQGTDSGLHGARLDVIIEEEADEASGVNGEIFDVEPENDDRKKSIQSLPRRVRFYHSKIDSRSLRSGQSYDRLKNVYVIMILPFDPLGQNRMLYTARTMITEDPGIPYDDGAASFFFYINGDPKDVPLPVQQLLAYMQKSEEENAVNESLREIHRMTCYVKRDEIVEDTYMKWFEREEMIREDGWEAGHSKGREEGAQRKLIDLVCKKLEKGKSIPEIAEALEEDEETVRRIVSAAEPYAPDYDCEAILTTVRER